MAGEDQARFKASRGAKSGGIPAFASVCDVDPGMSKRDSPVWGVVTRREMLRVGVTVIEIRRRVQKGLLIRQYPGVYRVGHAAPSGLIKGKPPKPEVYAPTERRIKRITTHAGKGKR